MFLSIFVGPRSGDTVSAYADVEKIEKKIGWKANYSLEEALKNAWEWEKKSLICLLFYNTNEFKIIS